ncbi:MAG: Ig-like domain-containing protein, partial [Chloroflexota bacterium]
MNKKHMLWIGIAGLVIASILVTRSILITSNTPIPVEIQPTGPQVVGQNPIEGGRLDLMGTIEITFDRDMDPAKTAAAFSLRADDEPVPGQATWRGARTLVFTPESKLKPSTVYTAVFSADAAAADGTPLLESIELEFKTVEALAVSQVFPAPDTEDVSVDSSITVIFNHPVAPVTIVEEQDNLPQPLTFTPALAGRGEWVNSSVYVYQPETVLLSGTRYTVRVDAGLKDVSGDALGESFRWEFGTYPPVIKHYSLKGGEQNPKEEIQDVALDQAFIVKFSQAMKPESVEAATSIVNRETLETFPLEFEWNEDNTSLTIEPDGKFKLASYYRLALTEDAQAEDGGMLREGLLLQFATVPYPRIVAVYPKPDSTPEHFTSHLSITFASPMNFESMKGRVLISPALEGEPQWYYNAYNKTLYIHGLAPATDYVVRILPGMEDRYGNKIRDEYSFTFKNKDYDPYARLVLPWTPLIYRANGRQEVYFEYLNLDSAKLTVYSIDVGEFNQLMNGDLDMTRFRPKGAAVREWTMKESPTRNELQRLNFNFDENGTPLEPGYYFIGVEAEPQEYTSRYYQGFVFVVATHNLTLKTTNTEALAWVVDLESGKPQSNVSVTFYDQYFNEVDTVKTDKDGLAYTDKLNSAVFAASVTGTEYLAFTAINWGSGVSAGDFGIYQNYYGQTIGPFAYLYTDRPVYRPGQEVYFKGILRQNDDLHYTLPSQEQVYVTIESAGEEVYSEKLPISELGSFDGVFKLAEEAQLGTYMLSVRYAPGAEPFGHLTFRVAEYHKPEFEVIASPDRPSVLSGETVNFALDAAYYSGGNLHNANVDWHIQSTPYYFNPVSDYDRYSFADWDRDTYWTWQRITGSKPLDEGKDETDENGHLVIEQKTDLGEARTSQVLTFNANVTDVAGNLVSGSASVVVHQSQVYAGIRSERYIGAQGEGQSFSVVVLDWDSNPVAGQTVRVQFVERQWYSVQKEDEQGQLQWVTSVKEIPVDQKNVITGEDGAAQVSFTPPKGGIYKATVTVRDSKGNTHHASTYIWVAGNDHIAWRQTNDRSFSLIADKDMYKPGETAELLIAQPFEGKVYALVTYERGHIYKQEVLLLEGNSTVYKLPITDEMAPIAYISVTVISGADNTDEPDFKIGMTAIHVDTTRRTINVSVTADKTAAGPNDEVTYTITTKDVNGTPVPADVSLALVDKAALALAPSNSRPMLASFYSEKSLSVRTALGILLNAEDFNANYRKTIPEGGGSGGGGGAEDSLGIITVRENFKDTAAFRAQVTTDENGRAQVKVTLPENLTTWHADVRAVTEDSRVGEAIHELVSTKPVFVQLTTPRFFVVGDEVRLGAIIHNNTSSARQVKVTLDAQGVEVTSAVEQTVEIEGKQQVYVTWNAVVDDDAQRVDLTATAVSGPYSDASKPALGTLSDQGIPVFNYTAVETVGTSGMLLTGDSVTESIQLPTSYNFTDASLSVEVSPSLAASMQSGLDYLEDYPYLCMEQTVSESVLIVMLQGFLAYVANWRYTPYFRWTMWCARSREPDGGND